MVTFDSRLWVLALDAAWGAVLFIPIAWDEGGPQLNWWGLWGLSICNGSISKESALENEWQSLDEENGQSEIQFIIGP